MLVFEFQEKICRRWQFYRRWQDCRRSTHGFPITPTLYGRFGVSSQCALRDPQCDVDPRIAPKKKSLFNGTAGGRLVGFVGAHFTKHKY